MTRDTALQIASLTKHQYYHQPASSKKQGRPKSTHTKKKDKGCEILVEDKFVIDDMIRIDTDPDLRCGTKRMTAQLQIMGYIINKKKVARLMKENGLTKNSVNPASRALDLLRGDPYPVIMITGTVLFGESWLLRIILTRSMPFMAGICQSVITMSGQHLQNSSNPFSPSEA